MHLQFIFSLERKMKFLILLALTLTLTMANEVALQEFTTGNNLFTAAIYREVTKENFGNFLISPFSIQTVFALTQSGAKDPTAAEIRNKLNLPDSPEKTDEIYSAILPTLKGNEQYALHTANKIYVKNDYPVKEEFKNVASNVYQAGIENIDFTQKTEAATAINGWVEKQTNNKIHDLIDPNTLDADTRIILINALYFKGKWVNPFESYATRKRDFYKTPKDIVKVDTMQNTDLYNYYESPELKAKFLEMPYLGDDISMVIVLPNEKDGLEFVESQVDKVFTTHNFTQERVSVSLPKFSIENKVQLKKILQNLGVNTAFTDEADLSGIAGKKGELAISDVVQKAFINVTETGTEAAAATAASVVVTLSLPPQHGNVKQFKANHPFVFYLKLNEFVLLAGKYNTP
ncbi:antichymotrypsin-2 isoform X4 [Tribolium castaneum]|uniref:antichymotrypsin-2 isoform X4 n=1 Tax=Tribolium castaneum TaxID=7070 RepID=UPI00077DC39E|nr:PREDICTED: antichymotrypsin-2 isoform X4 [Tribolium castaneum]|eukprot:XP_015840668.1 PREDICTED: antichymotrypsin-2 isoform X4 [Tribolium castaneum]